MNGLALFAGGGGLELGVSIAEPGYRVVCHVEREAYAAACIVARMEEAALAPAPVWDDVATFDGRPWRGVVDIVTAGYPCQGESNAGKRRGTDDERWLWPEVARILEETGAPVFFGENVGAHLSRSARIVIGELQDMGRRVAAGLFTAFEGGASHERERLFILAHAERERRREGADAIQPRAEQPEPWACRKDLADPDRPRRQDRDAGPGQAATPAPGDRPPERRDLDLADTLGNRRAGAGLHARRRREGQGAARPSGHGEIPVFAPGPADRAAWRRALERDPALEPAVRGMADGPAYRVDRLRLLGNGVVPLEAAYAYRTLKAALSAGDGAGQPAAELAVRA